MRSQDFLRFTIGLSFGDESVRVFRYPTMTVLLKSAEVSEQLPLLKFFFLQTECRCPALVPVLDSLKNFLQR